MKRPPDGASGLRSSLRDGDDAPEASADFAQPPCSRLNKVKVIVLCAKVKGMCHKIYRVVKKVTKNVTLGLAASVRGDTV